jgi:long-chain acyl-CoA synthetase
MTDRTFSNPLAPWLPEEPAADPDPDLQAHDLATIVYTSGTTGLPKGVMLSHANILANCRAVLAIHPARIDDIFLSFLPLSHSFERTVGHYIPMMAGCCIAYCRSIQELAEDMLVIRPTILISVPRIYERISARIQEQLSEKGKSAQLLFAAAVKVGYRRFLADRAQKQPTLSDRLLWPILNRLVADKILQRFGGRLRLAVTGGAPLQAELSRLFIGLGLPLVQGYGLTEAAPVISANRLQDNRPESVGPPLPGVEVRLNEQQELLVRSPGVMLGYWNKEEADPGSAGQRRVAENRRYSPYRGRIHLYHRTLQGDPGDLHRGEDRPCSSGNGPGTAPLIDQAMVVGEGKPYVAALLVSTPAWQRQATRLGLDPMDPPSCREKRPEVRYSRPWLDCSMASLPHPRSTVSCSPPRTGPLTTACSRLP